MTTSQSLRSFFETSDALKNNAGRTPDSQGKRSFPRRTKYFEVIKYEIEDEAKIPVDEASFLSVIVIDGEGTIMTDDNDKELKFKAGESFFINAGKQILEKEYQIYLLRYQILHYQIQLQQ